MQKSSPLIVLAIASLIVLSACAEPTPQTVEVTRQVGVPETVEVTRQVTRIVEKIVEETVEVTRIEQVVVTATPTSTSVPSPTPSAAPTARPEPTAEVASQLLREMRSTRQDLEAIGGLIDDAVRSGVIYCQQVVDLHDSITSAPGSDASGGSDVAQWASARHQQAIQVYSEGGSALAEGCDRWLKGQGKDIVATQTWTRARKSVNDALDILIPAIEKLE